MGEDPSQRMKSEEPPFLFRPLGVALVYFGLGAAWILFSDQLVAALGQSSQQVLWLQTVKGWAFVGGTALVMYGLIRQGYDQIQRWSRAAENRRSELKAILEASPHAIVVLNPDATVSMWSSGAEELFGWSADETVGRLPPHLPDSEQTGARQKVEAILEGETVDQKEVVRQCRDGSPIEVALSTAPVEQDGGAIGVVATYVDLGPLKRSERLLRMAMDVAQAGVWTWDLTTDAVTWSQENYRLLGLDPDRDAASYEAWIERIHPEDRGETEAAFQRAVDRGEDVNLEFRIIRTDGSIRWMQSMGRLSFDRDGTPTRMIGFQIDITDRKRLERALRRRSRKLLHAQERERRRIAHELHDETGALLTSLQICLDSAEHYLSDDVEMAREEIDESKALVKALSKQVRQLSLNLRPGVLDDMGLAAALDWLAERQRIHNDLDVTFYHEIDEGQRFPDAIETVAYRIVQEALTNVVRHAEVDEAQVMVNVVPDRLRIHVTDEGEGFDPSGEKKRESMGLTGMRERVELVGGTLDVASAPGEGTRISATIPLEGAG
jgi:PAS domain S-box-containing protein